MENSFDISLKLRNKIRRDLVMTGFSYFIVADGESAELKFNDDEMDIYQECCEWLDKTAPFSLNDDYLCISKIGRFINLKPVSRMCGTNYIIFYVQDHCAESWRDWLDIDGKDDGYLIGKSGKIVNERTFKDAS